MTDTTQGADAPNDAALFNDAVSTTTLDKFENPELPAEPKAVDPPKVADPKPVDPPKEEALVPSGRLREEIEARQRAERRYDELLARGPQQQPAAPEKVDMFEAPDKFRQQIIDEIRAERQAEREAQSLIWARRTHGVEKVDAAFQAMKDGMARQDPNAWSAYNRAMSSLDPYDAIVGWHQDGEVLRTVGRDPNAYVEKAIEEKLKSDPAFAKRVYDQLKGQAASTGNSVARPVKSSVASSPSLGNFGAGGGDDTVVEPSDEQLFRAAVTAKRR